MATKSFADEFADAYAKAMRSHHEEAEGRAKVHKPGDALTEVVDVDDKHMKLGKPKLTSLPAKGEDPNLDGNPDQPRDDHGRFGSGGGGSKEADAASKLQGVMNDNPMGFSWRPDTEHAKTGIMVAEHPSSGSSETIDYTNATEKSIGDAISSYVDKHYDQIMKDPSLHFGGWKNTDDKGNTKFYLDISKQFPKEQRDAAITQGQRNNQIAVWDVDNMSEIKTGGSGE